MKTRNIGMLLMLVAIGMLGFQIGATAKYEDNRYLFLMPVAIGFLLVGMFLWFRDISKRKKKEE